MREMKTVQHFLMRGFIPIWKDDLEDSVQLTGFQTDTFVLVAVFFRKIPCDAVTQLFVDHRIEMSDLSKRQKIDEHPKRNILMLIIKFTYRRVSYSVAFFMAFNQVRKRGNDAVALMVMPAVWTVMSRHQKAVRAFELLRKAVGHF